MRLRLAVLVVALLASIAPGEAAAAQVMVKNTLDSDLLKVRPRQIVLSADGTLALERVAYRSYGGPVARATAIAYTRGCVPDCADGEVLRPRATLRLSHRMQCQRWTIYGRLEYVLDGAIPEGVERRASFDLRLTDERGKPLC